jgi:hypothetical protein
MPPRPRRFLLAADLAARVYLDLSTGAEVVEPSAPAPDMPRPRKPTPPPPPPSRPLAEVVAECLSALEMRYDTLPDGTLRLFFQGRLMNPEVQIECTDDSRIARFRLDLQVAVPPSKQEYLLKAVEVLNRTYCTAQLLFNENTRSLQVYHPVFLADLEPTPAFVFEQLRVLMHQHDVLHHLLAHILFKGSNPDTLEGVARDIEVMLEIMWSPPSE